ncbi:MAG: GTP cyclohydrolase I FolE [Gemmatimonadota bacterium]|nr:GTP cyclohydrolase I FolE [Gemmatimonadota bacterium]
MADDAGRRANDAAERLVYELLKEIDEDPEREGLIKTPARVVRALRFLTEGYRQDPDVVLGDAFFAEEYDEMVLVGDIEFYSLCEHHMLPFFGWAHVAYIPERKIVGLSKIPRLVDLFARRLQVQERMTKQIAETIEEKLDPIGVGVVVEARHLCMVMRGVEKQHSTMTTSHMLGAFREEPSTRMEFMNLIGRGGRNHR